MWRELAETEPEALILSFTPIGDRSDYATDPS